MNYDEYKILVYLAGVFVALLLVWAVCSWVAWK